MKTASLEPQHVLAALWPFGCAGALATVAALVLHGQSGLNAWIIYCALGVIVPIAALIFSSRAVPERARVAAGGAGLLLIAYYVLRAAPFATLPLAALEVAVILVLSRRSFASPRAAAGAAAVMGLVATGAWALAGNFSTNVPIRDLLAGRVPLMGGAWIFPAFVVATIVATLTFFVAAPRSRAWALVAVDAAAVVLFAIVSSRRDIGFAYDDHHVSFFIGPVEVVRQGGWLLWDAPSQYGIGNIFVMAHLPVSTAYAAVMDTNAVLVFIAAIVTYAIARGLARTWWAAAAWCVLILAVNFFVPDWVNGLGPEHFPSVGPMRFIWCYAFVGLLVFAYRRADDARTRRAALLAGTAMWAAAVAWSAESGLYATCAWFPAAAALAWRGGGEARAGRTWFAGALRALLWIGAAAGALALLVLWLQLVYVASLGQGPDWRAYVEFGLLYGSGLGALGLNPTGPVWVLIADFAALVAIAAAVVRQTNRAALPLTLGLCGVQWATASYFVMRSHPNNVTNLLSLQILVLAAGLLVASREQLGETMVTVVRLYLVPIAATVCALCFSSPYGLPRQMQIGEYLRGSPGNWAAVASQLPAPIVTLLRRHGLGSESPVLYDIGPTRPLTPLKWPDDDGVPRVWTPARPIPMFGILPVERQSTYVRRFMTAHPMTGYLVTNTKPAEIVPRLGPGIHDALQRWYEVTDLDREGPYVLTRYMPRSAPVTPR